ncbi:MAG: nitroreductase family deazaflavin-dependent oxidoreductase [Candidatus Nanopelagicales bacterium]
MGLRAELGFYPGSANAVQRAMQRAAQTKTGAWVFQRTLYRIDRPLHRWSKGRYTIPWVATGLPIIMVTSIGAKSGLPRTMPVAGIPLAGEHSEDIAVLGTNYAQAKSPAWVFNLAAHPECSVAWLNNHAQAVAVPITDPHERDALWHRATEAYVGFAAYRARINHREVRMFRLTMANLDG